MKSLFFFIGLLLTLNVNAQTLIGAEPKTPFVRAGCATIGVDSVGVTGLRLEDFSVSQTADQITLSVTSSLSVCRLSVDANDHKSLAWLEVNPYKGFQVQYFDENTLAIKERPVYIDSNKAYNRIELVVALTPEKISQGRMQESLENTFSGSVSFKKSDLLTKKELKDIRSGKTVEKMIELYHVGNFTTIVNGEDQHFGDQGLSAQNVILTFKK